MFYCYETKRWHWFVHKISWVRTGRIIEIYGYFTDLYTYKIFKANDFTYPSLTFTHIKERNYWLISGYLKRYISHGGSYGAGEVLWSTWPLFTFDYLIGGCFGRTITATRSNGRWYKDRQAFDVSHMCGRHRSESSGRLRWAQLEIVPTRPYKHWKSRESTSRSPRTTACRVWEKDGSRRSTEKR